MGALPGRAGATSGGTVFDLSLGFGKPFPFGHKAELTSGWWRPRAGHRHLGADLFAPIGTPVVAVAPGLVIRAQRVGTGDAAGIWVGLQHDHGIVTRYMHLSSIDPDIGPGARVSRGQLLGHSGTTGSEGAHLHFDVKAPAAILPAIEASVGQPTTGWGPLTEWGYGIPAEPWLPVDSYAQRTIDDAKQYGIPLERDRGGGLGQLLLVGAICWAGYHLLR